MLLPSRLASFMIIPPSIVVSYPTYCTMPTVVELKAELRELGLPTNGLKAELQSRLRAHHCDRNANAGNNNGEAANNDDDNSRPRPQDHPSCNGGSSGAAATVGGRALTNRASATKEKTKMSNGSKNNANGSSTPESSSVSSSIMKKQRKQSNYMTMISIALLAILIANVVPVLDIDLLPESIQGGLLPLLQRYRNYYDGSNNTPRHATTTTAAATTTTTLISDNRDTSSTPIMSYETTDVTDDEKLNLNTDDTDIDDDVNVAMMMMSVGAMISNNDEDTTPVMGINDTPPPPLINAHKAGRMGDMAALTAIGAKNIGLLNIRDANGWTPLHEAARGGHLEAVKFLIEHGLDKVRYINSCVFFDFIYDCVILLNLCCCCCIHVHFYDTG